MVRVVCLLLAFGLAGLLAADSFGQEIAIAPGSESVLQVEAVEPTVKEDAGLSCGASCGSSGCAAAITEVTCRRSPVRCLIKKVVRAPFRVVQRLRCR